MIKKINYYVENRGIGYFPIFLCEKIMMNVERSLDVGITTVVVLYKFLICKKVCSDIV